MREEESGNGRLSPRTVTVLLAGAPGPVADRGIGAAGLAAKETPAAGSPVWPPLAQRSRTGRPVYGCSEPAPYSIRGRTYFTQLSTFPWSGPGRR